MDRPGYKLSPLVLGRALSQMEPREAEAVIGYYVGGDHPEEIGNALGVSCEEAQKLAYSGLARLRYNLLPPNTFPTIDI